MSDRSPRYTAVAIALHWAIAIAIVFIIWLGWNMDNHEARFQLHKSVGITILLLTIARIVWRLLNPPPTLPEDMKPPEKTASHVVHLGFYGLMLAMPLTGWLVVSTHTSFDVPTVLYGTVSWPDIPGVGFLTNDAAHEVIEFVHSKLAWLAIGMLGLHVAGALKHEFSGEEGVLKRMLPGLFGRTQGPRAPSKGFITAFGSAFAVFAIIAGLPLASGALRSAPDAEAASFAPNWTVDQAASSIAFSGIHDGNPYNGDFGNWDAAIRFDADDIAAAQAEVNVYTGSATANQKLYTDSLKSAEWLNSAAHPVATVKVDAFAVQGDGYTSAATLTLKDITVTVPLDFTLEFDGDTALMRGSTVLQRKALDLGQGSDPGADWVGEDVTVNVTVRATRRPAGQ